MELLYILAVLMLVKTLIILSLLKRNRYLRKRAKNKRGEWYDTEYGYLMQEITNQRTWLSDHEDIAYLYTLLPYVNGKPDAIHMDANHRDRFLYLRRKEMEKVKNDLFLSKEQAQNTYHHLLRLKGTLELLNGKLDSSKKNLLEFLEEIEEEEKTEEK